MDPVRRSRTQIQNTMDRQELISRLSRYFDIRELVCDHTYKAFGQSAWDFLDTSLLECLLVLRTEILQRPIYVNTGGMTQRGLRCNMCQLVKEKKRVYLTMHSFGKAVDFTVQDMSAEAARREIIRAADRLPCPVRLEADVSWVHLDTRPCAQHSKDRAYVFHG